MAWTEKAISILKQRFTEGWSASQIAGEIATQQAGKFSRNAVIGKIHRLGLYEGATSRRSGPAPSRRAVKDRARAMRAPAPRPEFTATQIKQADMARLREMPPLQVDGELVTVLTIRGNQCRYPYGDPRNEEFAFCARPCGVVGPYCADHARLCYTPSAHRKRVALHQKL